MQAKKSLGLPRGARAKWGQYFLRDKKILKKIADFAQIGKEDTVVEVGPGEGSLTEFLLEKAKKIITVEKDEELVKLLKEKFKKEIEKGKLEIIYGDILDIENLLEIAKLEIGNYIIIGNIPYYITGALFKKFLESENPPKSITFVVQKEVADRIMGSHLAKATQDKKESILSISIKVYGKPEYGGIIKAGSFSPKPKVDSAIISVRNINKDRFKEITPLILRGAKNEKKVEKKFFEILKAGFAHKRKLLIRNLADVSRLNLDILGLEEIFEKCSIPKKARAENLKVEDWICLTKNLL